MTTLGDAYIEIHGDVSRLGNQVERDVSGALGRAGRVGGNSMMSSIRQAAAVGGGIAATLGLAKVGTYFKDAAMKASDFAESANKISVIFKDAAPAINQWAETSAYSVGLSSQAALDAAASFGQYGGIAGKTGTELAGFSTDLVTLAADMASFSNTPVEEAVRAIGAAFKGENEQLENFGVILNANSVAMEGVRLGFIKTKSEAMEPANQVLAVQSLLLKQTALQQGDFQRTSEGLANAQRILAARFEDVQRKVGQALLPVALQLTQWASAALPIFERVATVVGVFLGNSFKTLQGAINGVANNPAVISFGQRMLAAWGVLVVWVQTVLLPVLQTIGEKLTSAFGPVIAWVQQNLLPVLAGLGTSLGAVLLPIVLTIAGAIGGALFGAITALVGVLLSPVVLIGVLAGALVLLWQRSETFRNAVMMLAGWLTTVLVPALMSLGMWLVANLVPAFQAIAGFITTVVVPALVSIATWIWTVLLPAAMAFGGYLYATFLPTFRAIADVVMNVVIPAIMSVAMALIGAWPQIATVISAVVSVVKVLVGVFVVVVATVLGKVLPVLVYLAGFLINTLALAIRAAIGIFRLLVTAIQAIVIVVRAVVGAAISLFQGFVGTIRGIVNVIVGIFTGDFGKIKTGVSQAISGVVKIAGTLPGMILRAVGNLGSMLMNSGYDLVSGLITGIRNSGSRLWSAVTGFISENIPGPVKRALGIASPSKVMAALGRWVPEGLAVGITANASSVVRAAGTVARAVEVAMAPDLADVSMGGQVPSRSRAAAASRSGGSGASGMEGLLRELIDELRRRPDTVVQLDGREIARVVDDRVGAGAATGLRF